VAARVGATCIHPDAIGANSLIGARAFRWTRRDFERRGRELVAKLKALEPFAGRAASIRSTCAGRKAASPRATCVDAAAFEEFR
jgi:hypothetical protein